MAICGMMIGLKQKEGFGSDGVPMSGRWISLIWLPWVFI
jgi:hypothetical protein